MVHSTNKRRPPMLPPAARGAKASIARGLRNGHRERAVHVRMDKAVIRVCAGDRCDPRPSSAVRRDRAGIEYAGCRDRVTDRVVVHPRHDGAHRNGELTGVETARAAVAGDHDAHLTVCGSGLLLTGRAGDGGR